MISRERAEELCPGIVSIDGKEEKMAKAKKIAALSAANYSKRQRSALPTSMTDKELTAFTELDGAVND